MEDHLQGMEEEEVHHHQERVEEEVEHHRVMGEAGVRLLEKVEVEVAVEPRPCLEVVVVVAAVGYMNHLEEEVVVVEEEVAEHQPLVEVGVVAVVVVVVQVLHLKVGPLSLPQSHLLN